MPHTLLCKSYSSLGKEREFSASLRAITEQVHKNCCAVHAFLNWADEQQLLYQDYVTQLYSPLFLY